MNNNNNDNNYDTEEDFNRNVCRYNSRVFILLFLFCGRGWFSLFINDDNNDNDNTFVRGYSTSYNFVATIHRSLVLQSRS